MNLSHILYTYKIITKSEKESTGSVQMSRLNKYTSRIKNQSNSINFKGFNLPQTMDFFKWGCSNESNSSIRILCLS